MVRQKPLNERQQRFVDAYLVSLNATRAAAAAGYSAKTANEKGSQLLAKVSVQAALSESATALRERTGIDQQRLIEEWATIGFAPVGKPLTWESKTKALSELSARLWPVPREPEQPKAVTVRVIYEGEQGKTGVEVRLEQ